MPTFYLERDNIKPSVFKVAFFAKQETFAHTPISSHNGMTSYFVHNTLLGSFRKTKIRIFHTSFATLFFA